MSDAKLSVCHSHTLHFLYVHNWYFSYNYFFTASLIPLFTRYVHYDGVENTLVITSFIISYNSLSQSDSHGAGIRASNVALLDVGNITK
jgi:hypothetical protein